MEEEEEAEEVVDVEEVEEMEEEEVEVAEEDRIADSCLIVHIFFTSPHINFNLLRLNPNHYLPCKIS